MELRRRTALARFKNSSSREERPKTWFPGETYFTLTKVGRRKEELGRAGGGGAVLLLSGGKAGEAEAPEARVRTVSQWRFEGLAGS